MYGDKTYQSIEIKSKVNIRWQVEDDSCLQIHPEIAIWLVVFK